MSASVLYITNQQFTTVISKDVYYLPLIILKQGFITTWPESECYLDADGAFPIISSDADGSFPL